MTVFIALLCYIFTMSPGFSIELLSLDLWPVTAKCSVLPLKEGFCLYTRQLRSLLWQVLLSSGTSGQWPFLVLVHRVKVVYLQILFFIAVNFFRLFCSDTLDIQHQTNHHHHCLSVTLCVLQDVCTTVQRHRRAIRW